MARNSSRQFRKTAAFVIATSDGTCGICGHGGAITVDHIRSFRDWPTDELGQPLPGLDSAENLRPAHGTRGIAEPNPCHQCDPTRWPRGRLCNQSRGPGTTTPTDVEPHSKNW